MDLMDPENEETWMERCSAAELYRTQIQEILGVEWK